MGFLAETYVDDQEVMPDNLNQLVANDVYLFDRFIPILGENRVSRIGLTAYIVDFSEPRLIDPNSNGGNGWFGVSWTKLWEYNNALAIAIALPPGIFSGRPYIVGHTTGSRDQWGISPKSRWGESASGYSVSFRDSGGENIRISTPFGYTAILIGPRAGDPL